MKSERKTEILVGLVVTLAFIVLTFGLIWGKGMALFTQQKNMVVRFDNIRGLEEGDPVMIRGLKQGEVEKIVLSSQWIETHLWLKKEVPLYTDMVISLEIREIMGGMQIAIQPGKSGTPADLDMVYNGVLKGDLWTVMDQGSRVMAKTDTLLDQLNLLLSTSSLENTLNDLEAAARYTKEMVSENRRSIRETADRLNDMTRQLEEDSVTFYLGNIVSTMDSTVSTINTLALRIEKEEGTLGKLVRDRELYDQFLGTVVGLDSLITDIKANPKKYVRFSLF